MFSTVFWIFPCQFINLFTIWKNFENRKHKNVRKLFCPILKSTYYTSLKRPWMKWVSPVLKNLSHLNKACGPSSRSSRHLSIKLLYLKLIFSTDSAVGLLNLLDVTRKTLQKKSLEEASALLMSKYKRKLKINRYWPNKKKRRNAVNKILKKFVKVFIFIQKSLICWGILN